MAKVIFCWPPIPEAKGYPCATQNRQFQYFKDPTFIYPMVAAQCASMILKKKGEEVLWLDCIAEELNDVDFGKILVQMSPDYIIFEACTPLINRYYEVINSIKTNMPKTKVIICGEHATALPEEVKEKCKADYVITGGKWQKTVYKIIVKKDWEGELPHIDRNATRWWLYGYKNGNYKYLPGTYIMAAQDCWHRPGCGFCSWANYHQECITRSVDDVIKEIEELVNMGFKEIFDDSGTFPVGEWLDEFCIRMSEKAYDGKALSDYVSLGCNMRFGALRQDQFTAMAKAGFRMILWGLESVNQKTLDILNKKVNIEDITKDLMLAKACGLQSHITVMFGYSWETWEEVRRTYKMARWLLLKDWAFSAQATICIPYPGTSLFELCKKKGLLLTENWDDYDMSKPVMTIPYSEKKLFSLQKGIYRVAYHPKFLWNKIKMIRDFNDLKYYLRIGRKVFDRFGNAYEVGKVSMD